ncbi:hypothetical protein GOP47_0018096 [Adiantum capillus-veneris]|uniref:NADP-dependent oxidoreductase domain-containing protein n=1 Tax=Adiantum capillus-veneris TaxID=13818 RepID=A0A9D4Z9T9_ADICA|nr:hypothetical protein GOP47_0018096 [Adiantum capillus-veneris]
MEDNILKGHLMGIGTWSWGDKKMWGFGGYDKDLSEATAEAAFRKSLECGLGLIDTAAMYGEGESERMVGKFLKRLSPEERSEVLVASKYCPMPWHLNARSCLITSLKESLGRLQMERVDLFQIHGPALSIRSIEHLAQGLADAYDAGLTKAVGVSNFSQDEVRKAHQVLAKRKIPLASNQVEFSLLRMAPMVDGLFSTCSELGVQILAYSPLGMGRLTGKYSAANPPPDNRRFGNVPIEKMQPLLKKMNTIAEAHNKSVSQVALNWIICKGAIPIPGAKNEKQAEQNAGALGWQLTVEEIEDLDKMGFHGSTNWLWQHG